MSEHVTDEQIITALKALGAFSKEKSREGLSEKGYSAHLVNALLGIVEADALEADGSGLTEEEMGSAHWQALLSAGVGDDDNKLLGFLRWRALRVGGPLREIAQNEGVGPLPLAAAYAVEGLQLLLGVCAAGQDLPSLDPLELKADLVKAREALANAIGNIDIFLGLLNQLL